MRLIAILLFFTLICGCFAYTYDEEGNLMLSDQSQSIVSKVSRKHTLVYYDFDIHKTRWANGYRFYKKGNFDLELSYSDTIFAISFELGIKKLLDIGICALIGIDYGTGELMHGIGFRFYRVFF